MAERERGEVDPLVLAGLPREVRWEGETYEVTPPTIKQAVETLAILPDVAVGDSKAWDRLCLKLLPQWMPKEVIVIYASCDEVERARLIEKLIYQGAEISWGSGSAGGKSAIAAPGWDDALALYCQVYGGEPWDVYNKVPFSFFHVMLDRVDRHRSRQTLWDAEAVSLPHMGKEAKRMMQNLKRAAGYIPKDEDEKYVPDEDFIETAKLWRAAQKTEVAHG